MREWQMLHMAGLKTRQYKNCIHEAARLRQKK
jgi:hypothetical protein